MAVNSQHPSYVAMKPAWDRCDDCFEGQQRIKDKGPEYLPPTGGMVANGYGVRPDSIGSAEYAAYIARAVYHDFFQQAVIGMTSIVHRKKGTIEVPKVIEGVLEKFSPEGEDVWQVWRRITQAQLKDGRAGLLVDVPTTEESKDALPYVALYAAARVINWAEKVKVQGRKALSVLVLDESAHQMDDNYEWKLSNKYLLLVLFQDVDDAGVAVGEPVYRSQMVTKAGTDVAVDPEAWVEPKLTGQTLKRIPFVFVNHADNASEPTRPPLEGLADLTLTIYLGEADLRRALFLQGQDTLVLIGRTEEQKEVAVGAGAAIELPQGGQAMYIGVSSGGLPAMREQLKDDKAQAAQYAVQLLDTKGGDAESGTALRIRVSVRTASLASMQWTAAASIEEALRNVGRFKGLSEEVLKTIKVEPNLDFVDEGADANDVFLLMQAKSLGMPLLDEDLHAWLVKHEYTTKTWAEVKKGLEEEATDKASGKLPPDQDPTAGAGGGGGGFGGGGFGG